jgi:hypothetical protein
MTDPLNELVAAHPELFAGELPRIPSHLPVGWFALVDRLCSDIEALLQGRAERLVVVQVKEKFGGLRFYYDWDAADDVAADHETVLLRERVRAQVDEARARTTLICQRCGAPAVLNLYGGWTAALCERHASQR